MLTPDAVLHALDWAWSQAAKGLPGQASAETLASHHRDPTLPLRQRLADIVASHKRQTAVTGFLTNIGGLAWLPAALPANLAGTLYLQLRMVQTMALVCGHDLSDSRIRALCGLCLCGAKAAEVAGACGIRFGGRLSARILTGLGQETASRLNKLVGLRLLARFGESGALGASRIVPVVSGVIGAAWDASVTAAIGKAAMTLLPREAVPPQPT